MIKHDKQLDTIGHHIRERMTNKNMTHVLLKLEEESSGIFFEIKSLKGSYPNSFKPGAPADIMDSLNIGSSII